MAELASGAVNSLLGVIRNEAQLLGGVKGDVQFIREEMESMNSFLLHLARTASRGGEHDEPMRTWMNQVRLLAQDCNNCLDIYLYHSNPDIRLPKERLWRYFLWAPWSLRKLLAQHRAANQLRELKERARDVGKRWLRYSVEIPTTKAAQPPPGASAGHTAAAEEVASFAEAGGGGGEDDDDEDGANGLPATEVDRLLRVHDVDDYFNKKLADWMKQLKGSHSANAAESMMIPSIAIVAPDHNYKQGTSALAHGALAEANKVNFRTVMIDIPNLHDYYEPLQSEEILFYMWRELERAKSLSSSSQQQQSRRSSQDEGNWQQIWTTYLEKMRLIHQIRHTIQETMKVGDKIEKIKSEITKVTEDKLELEDLGNVKDDKLEERKINNQPLPVLLRHLNGHQARKKKIEPSLCEKILEQAAIKLKRRMEAKEHEEEGAKWVAQICLKQDQYAGILREVFLESQEQVTATASTRAMSEDQIKAMICDAKQEAKREILLEMKKMLEEKSDKKQATREPSCEGQIPQAGTEETKKIDETLDQIPQPYITEMNQKVRKIQQRIEALMKIQGIVDKILCYLKDGENFPTEKDDERIMIIINMGNKTQNYVLRWEEAKNALMLLGLDHVAGAVIVTTRDTQRAKEYCSPLLEPMEYSLVGLYHDIVLELTRKRELMDEEGDSHIDSHVFRDILDECGPYEFSMKIFAHALYANPKRSIEELQKLHKTMKQVAPKSFGKVAKKMLKFSYGDLPKEYKTCLLYLAIFPRGYKIRRSTLIGRWVVEGLITTEDWRWHNSVHEAEKCFDVLVNRWLVYPADIGATGKVKSCTVSDLVHGFITKIAKKQRILETRLSHHLARHFSISNDLHLRGSEKIDKFLQRLYESSHLSVLKVLDLEDCHCFKKKQHYMKDICNKILLLKYLSLKRTDVTWLPGEINNLHELEVLDIRETQLPPHATRHVRLLKLKRLLAGQTDPSQRNTDSSSVQIPEKIEKMLDMEVLSNVKGTSHYLKDIGKLWQLRKLGVVIDDKDSHLKNLLQTISDLHECLQSLSITLPTSENEGTPSSGKLPPPISSKLTYPPEHLKSLRICGTTKKGQLLPLFVIKKGGQLNKVTLSNTWLKQKDLDILADVPTLHYLKLRRGAYRERKLTFDFEKDKFQNLKYIHVERSKITVISFHGGAPGVEKIVLPLTDLNLDGVENLTKLEELELNELERNDNSSTTTAASSSSESTSIFKYAKKIAKVTLRGTRLKEDDLKDLAMESNIRCLMLLDNSYAESKLTFNKNEFPELNLLVINCSNITDIRFNRDSTPKISEIVWSFEEMKSLSGITDLQRLRKLEFNGKPVLPEVIKDIKQHKNKPYFLHNISENEGQETGNTHEEDKTVTPTRFFCWKHGD